MTSPTLRLKPSENKRESLDRMRAVLLQKLMASSSSPHPQDSNSRLPPPLTPNPNPNPNPNPSKRKEMESSTSRVNSQREELWPNAAIDVLLLKFEDLCYNSHEGRQLGKTHWGKIAAAVNDACSANYSGVQCKYKWNRLKKSYNKAKLHGDPSKFLFFYHVDRIVKKASGEKIERIDEEVEAEEVEAEEEEEAEEEDDVDSTCEAASNESKPGSPSMSATDDDDMDRRPSKRRGLMPFTTSSFGDRMERRMTDLAQTMESIQRTRTNELKKLLDAQMEITTALVKNNRTLKHGDRVSPSIGIREMKETGLAPSHQGSNATFVPPVNFAMVDKGIYRSGFPNRANFPFLKTLKLRSIIYLCHGAYPEVHMEFLRAENIRIFQFGKESFQATVMGISEGVICEALKILLDARNHPVLIHCKRGKRPTSCLVACYRKIQNWCLASVFDEYQRFAGIKFRISDLQFIERFNVPDI